MDWFYTILKPGHVKQGGEHQTPCRADETGVLLHPVPGHRRALGAVRQVSRPEGERGPDGHHRRDEQGGGG